jgi:hypothetical protein
MAGLLGGLLESTIRKEMKNRIDEILRCGAEWNESAKILKNTLDKLITELQNATAKGIPLDPAAMKAISSPVTRLCKSTDRMARGFEGYSKTMTKISEKL